MQVEEKILQDWKTLSQRGDIAEIAQDSGLARITISEALNTGKMTMRVFTAIQKFYNERKDQINKLRDSA